MRCPICHETLKHPSGICRGRLPGAFGLTRFSSGPCVSTPKSRAAHEEKVRARAAAQQGAQS